VEIELLNFFKLYEFAQLVAPELWAEYERLRNLPFEELTAEDNAIAETEALEEIRKLGVEKGTAQFGKIRNDRLFVVWNRYHHKAEHLITKEIPDAITAEINSGRAKITALDASDKEVALSKSQIARFEIDVLGNNIVRANDRAVAFHDVRIESAIAGAIDKPGKVLSDLAAEEQCLAWLVQLMEGPKCKAKSAYQAEVQQRFGVSVRAFQRAWGHATRQTRNPDWRIPGRLKKS
jgi:hypothetical protein